ncbi:DUF6344 domain-containing protein [Streptomyces sp. SHP 1-2]|uniref:DUF6344 domain-containing protein n=1 Tax=Streptomyces sp. SHP 1-2 TaxID=2769489 RepID=UPI002237AB17|nr:DUF6344 domain-containing protein [Streptomyces sp. SHP 1-2]MCW5249977.1 hypothetical protein [Streptomyces sp. SHP 1-2]
MARNKVMTLWTAIVTAFLALCTALGLITTTATTAAAAAPQTGARGDSERGGRNAARPAAPEAAPWSWSHQTGSLPPTMKQRIRAEAHGKAPRCRHHPAADTATADRTADLRCATGTSATDSATAAAPDRHTIPLQR